jgi:type II secretion system protein I
VKGRRRTGGSVGIVCSKQGFTLLEILVALAILSTAVTIVFQLFSASLRNIAASEDHITATMRAEAKMREILNKKDLAENSWTETTDDGYRYTVKVSKTLEEKTGSLEVDVMEVDLFVDWVRGIKERSFRLKTLKMVNRQV